MRAPDELVSSVVRTWTRMYTIGLQPLDRDSRRAEIDSDLWEHAQAGRRGAARVGSAGQILARWLLGVGADLSWRAHMSVHTSSEEGRVDVNVKIKRDWWLPAPLVMVAGGVLMVLTHIVGDGFESFWSQTGAGWNPSLMQRAGAVLALGCFFLVLPVLAVAVRRTHPGLALAMLLPWVVMCLVPLGYSDSGGLLVIPVIGVVALVGAVVNLAQHSVQQDLGARTASGG